MTPEKLNAKIQELINTINEYRTSPDCPTDELEWAIDTLLCKLPRDIVYVEWYGRSDIKNIADDCDDDTIITDETLDHCMTELWEFNRSIMEYDTVVDIVNTTINQNQGK